MIIALVAQGAQKTQQQLQQLIGCADPRLDHGVEHLLVEAVHQVLLLVLGDFRHEVQETVDIPLSGFGISQEIAEDGILQHLLFPGEEEGMTEIGQTGDKFLGDGDENEGVIRGILLGANFKEVFL